MTQFKKDSYKVIGLAGRIGAGKTTLAAELRLRLQVKPLSFGDYVRFEAMCRGLNLERSSLQQLGDALIAELGTTRFVYNVLNLADGQQIQILDGIRHVGIWEAIKAVTRDSFLVYLDVDEGIRFARVQERDEGDSTVIDQNIHHAMEDGVARLKEVSDLIFSELSLLEIVSGVIKEIEIRGWRNEPR